MLINSTSTSSEVLITLVLAWKARLVVIISVNSLARSRWIPGRVTEPPPPVPEADEHLQSWRRYHRGWNFDQAHWIGK